ncbi:MAG: PEGA domain-containing protein [Bacteroidales bacterium]|nr:PEGA domain-containing protein [Bacteroidales bacterium]
MKKVVLLAIALVISLCSLAQLEVKSNSFKEVPGFVNINPDQDYQFDDNDLPFAVIKVRTENITDKQRRELRFEGNGGTFIVLEYKTGEVWVYLTAKYADYLKISHPDFSSIEFTLPFDLEPKKGYELTLVNKPAVDEDIVKRLEKLENASNVAPVVAPVVVPVEVVEKPKTDVGFITVKTTPKGAYVLVDNKIVGTTPYLSESVSVGNHKISVRLEGYEPAAQRLEIKKGEEIALEFALVSENITEENNEVINQISEPMAVEKKEGIFSISPRNEVVFSKGNVRLKSSDKRKFTDNQWDKGDLIAFDEIQSVVDSVWFVLSSDEWKYLLTKRRTDSGIRYAKATVNGVFGLVLLPDDWKTTIYGIKDGTVISKSDWTNKLEANGAVFLPAAGYRFNNWEKSVGTDGYYWSSDPEDTSYLRFNNAMLSTSTNVFDQEYGLSVRLVKENL